MSELPPASGRWRASHKRTVLQLVLSGIVTREEVISRYGMSVDELEEWQRHFALNPSRGLHAAYVASPRHRRMTK